MKKLFIAALLFFSVNVYSTEVDIVEFAKLENPMQLVYPPKAEREELEGTVVLKIQVLVDGSPGDVTIFKSSGFPLLDSAAIKSVKEARFLPAKNQVGVPVNSMVFLPVEFRLLP